MRWNCPHCAVGLSVEENKLGTGWNFSRCYQCGGFGLIRKSEVNLVKVDRVPQGEQILLPDLADEPLMGQKAIQNLDQIRGEIHEQRKQKAASAEKIRSSTPPPLPKEARVHSQIQMRNKPSPTAAPVAASPASLAAKKVNLVPTPKKTAPLLAACVASMIVAGFLFVQGRKLIDVARQERPAAAVPAQPGINTVADTTSAAQARSQAPVRDQLAERAMAPDRDSGQPAKTALVVRPKAENIFLRSGPGVEFPSVGRADPQTTYIVMDWKDRWLQIQLNPEQSAWVRNDLVNLVAR